MTTELENQNNLDTEATTSPVNSMDSPEKPDLETDSSVAQEQIIEPNITDDDSQLSDRQTDLSSVTEETIPANDLGQESYETQQSSTTDNVSMDSENLEEELVEDSQTVDEAEIKILALQAQIESLNSQLEQQKNENQNVNSLYMRLNADFENFRRRTIKEKEDLEQQIKIKTLSEILSVVDNFERARSQIKPNDDGEMAIHKSYQGVYKTLVDSLKRLGVSAMRPEGNQFDPNYHEAMLREPTNEHPEGTVLEQLVRGYLLEDKVLRHAMVKVATPKDDEDIEANNSSTEEDYSEKNN